MTPFEALYGHAPPTTKDYIAGNASIPSLDSSLQNRQIIINTLKHNLARSQKFMQIQANKKRRDYTFAIGDFVWLWIQPYCQTSVNRRTSQKLSKRFFRPFPILHRIGAITYKLQLPNSSRIHPVFHVSHLRAYHGSNPEEDKVPIPRISRKRVCGIKTQLRILSLWQKKCNQMFQRHRELELSEMVEKVKLKTKNLTSF